MHKTVFEYKPPNDKKDVLKFSSEGKQFTPDQLANNMKTVIHLRSLQDKAEEAEVEVVTNKKIGRIHKT